MKSVSDSESAATERHRDVINGGNRQYATSPQYEGAVLFRSVHVLGTNLSPR